MKGTQTFEKIILDMAGEQTSRAGVILNYQKW